MWWRILAIPALERLRQEYGKFEASLDYMKNPFSKIQIKYMYS
jgi:hypothetical protein